MPTYDVTGFEKELMHNTCFAKQLPHLPIHVVGGVAEAPQQPAGSPPRRHPVSSFKSPARPRAWAAPAGLGHLPSVHPAGGVRKYVIRTPDLEAQLMTACDHVLQAGR